MPFYGNITNKRNQFTYDKVYPNKKAMLQAVSSSNVNTVQLINSKEVIIEKNDDGVFVGRYILIDYGPTEEAHAINYAIDNEDEADPQKSWDSTVWQKIYVNNLLTYVLIAELNAKPADIRFLRYAPGYRSPGRNLKQPLVQEQVIGEENSFIIKAQDSYQIDIEVPRMGSDEFIYFPLEEYLKDEEIDIINKEGFNPQHRSYIENTQPEFSIVSKSTGEPYVTNEYDEIEESSQDILTWKIDLRELGNIASNFYDILYSKNRDAVEFLSTNDITKVSTADKSLNKLYCIGSTYYYIDENQQWKIAFDLDNKVGEDGSNSLFELLLNLRHLENLLVDKSESVSDMQMNIILSYFDSANMPETNSQLGEIMELKYIGYDDSNKTHKMQFTKTSDKINGILSCSVKFGEDFHFGDQVTLYKLPEEGKGDGTNPFLVEGKDTPILFKVIMSNGVEATENAWKKDTVGLINFGLDDDKVYIYSAVPTWG